MTRIRALAIASLFAASISLYAQAAPGGATPTFEVASIKRNTSGESNASFGFRPGGVLVVVNNSLRNIVRNAYGLQNFQIVGGPNWFDTDRFDITAKAAADAPPDQRTKTVQLRSTQRSTHQDAQTRFGGLSRVSSSWPSCPSWSGSGLCDLCA